ncbi:MAG: HEAT repeat domain-containing protein [Anaerolineales bacterium]|nr:HEAT repeat domain-containing protein [Anaerolineales bacterium]
MRLFKPNISKLLAKKDMHGLIEALGDNDSQIAEQAASALGNLRDPQVGGLLLEALDKPTLRRGAIRALGLTGNVRYLEQLSAALHDSEVDVRQFAIDALLMLPDPGVVEPLANALNDANGLVRWHAALGLATLKDPRGIDFLAELIEPNVLGVWDMTTVGPAIDALGKFGGSQAVKPLFKALQAKHSFVSDAAAEALGKIKDPGSIEPLRLLLKNPLGLKNVRRSAATALEAITGERHSLL